MGKRKERVAPPPHEDGWDLRFATNSAVKGWETLCSVAANNTRAAWEQLTTQPRRRTQRQHPLKDALATNLVQGKALEQWQYEVTGAGRLWYCIDDTTRTVWLTAASTGHPKATE